MTKAQALNKFFSSFSLLALEENSVPGGDNAPAFPYATYSLVLDSIGGEIPLTLNLWYRDKQLYSSLPEIIGKADEISERIGRGGITIPCDGGFIWLKRGTPFAQIMGDPADELIRRAYINITAEYLTAD